MGSDKEFYQNVWFEWVHIYNQLVALDEFIQTDDFKFLSDTEQELIYQQFEYMNMYALNLDKRLKLFNFIKIN